MRVVCEAQHTDHVTGVLCFMYVGHGYSTKTKSNRMQHAAFTVLAEVLCVDV